MFWWGPVKFSRESDRVPGGDTPGVSRRVTWREMLLGVGVFSGESLPARVCHGLQQDALR